MKKIIFVLCMIFSLTSFAQSRGGQDMIPLNKGIQAEWVEPEVVFPEPIDTNKLSSADLASIEADRAFLKSLPPTYENVPPADLKNLVSKFEGQIQKLIEEKEALLKSGAKPEVIESKNSTINSLNKEKNIVNLTIDKDNLTVETGELKTDKKKLKNYLIGAGIGIALLILLVIVLLQRKTIKVKDGEIDKQLDEIDRKNKYLEHAAHIIRHDMHSGINTYMPRGLSSLEKRISEDQLKELKIDGSVKMIKEGLSHTQKVYKSVYEFTNLVKPNSVLDKDEVDLKEILVDFITNTAYANQVEVSELKVAKVNKSLFCVAIDNLIKNGLKYNDSEKKEVKVFLDQNTLIVEDNGKGLSNEEFEKMRKSRKKKGLGLSISLAILEEHGFTVSCDKLEKCGTQIKINIS